MHALASLHDWIPLESLERSTNIAGLPSVRLSERLLEISWGSTTLEVEGPSGSHAARLLAKALIEAILSEGEPK